MGGSAAPLIEAAYQLASHLLGRDSPRNGWPPDAQRRLTDVLRRHGPDSPNAQVHEQRAPYLFGVGQRVEAQLRARLDS
jgi:hypothetical protein